MLSKQTNYTNLRRNLASILDEAIARSRRYHCHPTGQRRRGNFGKVMNFQIS
ncbi:hypothetical protein [Pleurocapsa sp. FMAR1]|uniref:hypothetical protein n=1 Tax=Pleurocapsa sp. FMAR1 TaxID=3040204 RepID=UPI0029C82EFD|nr:hypothetical protein [Pleurocapsa sp. FMAR1]